MNGDSLTQHIFWYAARSSGLIGWLLLSASVIWGLSLSSRFRPGGARPAWILDLHRHLGGLAVVFTGVHVAAIMADSYTDFGPVDVLVPFASSWNAVAVAWGIVAMYLLVAVELTSLGRKHLPRPLWKLIHLLSLPLWASSTIHLMTAGSERSNPLVAGSVWGVSALVVMMTLYRILSSSRRATPTRSGAERPAARKPRPAMPTRVPSAATASRG
jgi:hypothetical protein